MEKYCAAGLTWMHLDSHHHSHTDWSVAQVIVPIAKKMGFASVRRTRNIGLGIGVLNRLYKIFLDAYLVRNIGVETAYFGSYCDVVADMQKLREDDEVEVMVHPMYKLGTELTLDGDLVDTDHPMKDLRTMMR